MDAVDQRSLHGDDDPAVDEIESLVELILEDIMKWENCIPETEEDDTNRESEEGKNGLSFFALISEAVCKNSLGHISSSKIFFNLTPSILSTFRSVGSPPPEVII